MEDQLTEEMQCIAGWKGLKTFHWKLWSIILSQPPDQLMHINCAQHM